MTNLSNKGGRVCGGGEGQARKLSVTKEAGGYTCMCTGGVEAE